MQPSPASRILLLVGFRRGVVLVLSLLGFAVVISAAGFLLLYLLVSAEPAVPAHATLVLRPSGELYEVVPDDVVQLVRLAGPRFTVRTYVEALRRATQDRRVAGLLLVPQGLGSPFWAKVQEIREAVLDFRAAGKPVVALLESPGEQEYYLATAADRIVLVPTATLDLKGLALYELFLRGALDKLGTYPDFLHIGEYKTAANVYTERTYTDAQREMSASLVADQFDQLVRAIAAGRGLAEREVRRLIDAGPFLAAEAREAGLVDALGYADELPSLAPELAAADRLDTVELRDYARVGDRTRRTRRGAAVALLYVAGTIVTGRSRHDPVNGPLAGADTLADHIRAIRERADVRAVVVRIDSPGGSAVASDLIWRALTRVKTGSGARPVVVSMSDLAASGGYYVAMAGDVIVAQPGTLTGSIGVVAGKFVTGGTLDRLGVNLEATSAGQQAEIYSPDRAFTPAEREKILGAMQAFYDQFVEKAAEARHTTPETIAAAARGRVWTGRQAHEIGLVDELGGLTAALEVARRRARVAEDEEVQVIVYPPRRTLYELLSDQLLGPGGHIEAPAAALLGPRERRALASLLLPARLFRPGEALALLPHALAW